MTVVRPHSQWGIALIDGSERITGFKEKPRLDYWINGGFFVCAPAFLESVDADSVLERDAAGDAGREIRAGRLPPRRLLGVHGHLQGRGHPQRPLEL